MDDHRQELKVSEADNFDFILDAWALLAHFENEAGAERVRQVLELAAQGKLLTGDPELKALDGSQIIVEWLPS